MKVIKQIALLFVWADLHAASASVSWPPNPETDIAGYRLQWSADGEPLREVETAAIFQPITGPRRFWWAEIETP